jgi:hypothetical protein
MVHTYISISRTFVNPGACKEGPAVNYIPYIKRHDGLITSLVVNQTFTKLKPLVYSVLRFVLSTVTNIFFLLNLYDFYKF